MSENASSARESIQGPYAIVGVGARTSLGLNALQTTMGIRAEMLRPVETRFVDPKGDLVGMCCVNCVDPLITGHARWLALARPALLEATADWTRLETAKRGAASPLPLILAVPPSGETAPDQQPRQAAPVWEFGGKSVAKPKRFLDALRSEVPGLIDVNQSLEVVGGRAAGIQALSIALQLLAKGSPAVLVGGVDSYYDPDRLELLAQELRLHGLETENGFIPGEGAAFFLLVPNHSNSAYRRFATVLGCSTELEPRPWGSDDPCQALGMTAALRKATEAVGATRRIGWQITDVVDERHRVDEWQLAAGRTFELFTHEVRHEQPLLTAGDVGTASAALFVVEACMRWQTQCALSPLAVLALHSDGPERAAALLSGDVS